MKFVFKLIFIFLCIALVFLLTYQIWGQEMDILFSRERCVDWFVRIKPLAWIMGILLLISDILLPVPATGIMAALGAVYGILPGAVAGAAGSMGAGLTGYALARTLGKTAGAWIADPEELERLSAFFNAYGAYAVILSRAMPVMPEVIAILAGLAGMGFQRFSMALVLGAFPTALLYSWMGTLSLGSIPGAGIAGAVLLPILIWPFFLKWLKI